MKKFASVLPFLAVAFVSCSIKPQLKTEVDKTSGATIVSTERFNLGRGVSSGSVYARTNMAETPLGIQIQRIDNADTTRTFEIKVTADAQSPRLKIQKENSLILLIGGEELKFSALSVEANDSEPLTEYFPNFRREVAVFTGVDATILEKLSMAENPRIRVVGESRQEEARLNEEVQAAVKALLPRPQVAGESVNSASVPAAK